MVKKIIKREQKVGETVKVKNEDYIRSVSFKYSIKSYLSTIIGFVVYIVFVVSILDYITTNFKSEPIYALMILMWLYLCLRMRFIIPRPVQTYEDKKVITEIEV